MFEKRALRVFLPTEPVERAIRQDPLEQHRQFVGRLVPVVLSQLHHAVLHDVQGGLLVAHVIDRALESPLFDALEEVGEFLFGCQGSWARMASVCLLWRGCAVLVLPASNYRIVMCISSLIPVLQCDNAPASQKANES